MEFFDFNSKACHHERRVQGLTQNQLAEMAGVSTAMVSQFERDATKGSLENRRALFKALGLGDPDKPPMVDKEAHEFTNDSSPLPDIRAVNKGVLLDCIHKIQEIKGAKDRRRVSAALAAYFEIG